MPCIVELPFQCPFKRMRVGTYMYVQGSERVVNTRDFNMKVSNMYCKALMLVPKLLRNKNVIEKYICTYFTF